MRRYSTAPSISSGLVFSALRIPPAKPQPMPSSTSPAAAQVSAAEWTVSERFFRSPAPKWCATSTLTPPANPMRKPVNRDTRMVVEPTAPNAVEPANRPTTATSAILNNTCNRLEKIRGMLNRKIFFPSGPVVRSACAVFMSPAPLLSSCPPSVTQSAGHFNRESEIISVDLLQNHSLTFYNIIRYKGGAL